MTSKLRALFPKPIDRPLDGVIKADDYSRLLNELEEYVVTNEIETNIGKFLCLIDSITLSFDLARTINFCWVSYVP